ncbi:MAG: hypothetical protein JW908_17220 [Anaerolineales bacterium]|nr:hypothetical protein [Anaerolineales bacterium]
MEKNKLLSSFQQEITTAWSFPERGNWATHNPKYRGNFAPQIPRNILLKYSSEGDFVLDPMVGSGTTLIEAKLLHRDADGIDINPDAVKICNKLLDFKYDTNSKQKAFEGDARNLYQYQDNSVDLIITHPPYANIVQYSKNQIIGDLSNLSSIPKFFDELFIISKELFRVLKEDHYCAILIGDTRKAQHYIPLSYYLLRIFLKSKFILKEEIIKAQHNCVYSKRWIHSAAKYNFYLIMHEHLFIFRKPKIGENLSKIKYSSYNNLI